MVKPLLDSDDRSKLARAIEDFDGLMPQIEKAIKCGVPAEADLEECQQVRGLAQSLLSEFFQRNETAGPKAASDAVANQAVQTY